MNKKLFALLLIVPILTIISCNENLQDYSRIRSGLFYYNARNTKVEIFRKANIQLEIELATNDSSWYYISWIDNRSYDLMFIKKIKFHNKEDELLTKSLSIHVEIVKVAKQYYVSKSLSTSSLYPGKKFTHVDTLWFKQ